MIESKARRVDMKKPEQNASPAVRRKKIRAVRRQLDQGKYGLDRRLDVTLERILQDLVSHEG